MDSDTLFLLLDAVRTYCQKYLPNETPVAVAIRLSNGATIRHPLPKVERTPRRHSIDFRTVVWDGATYHLTPKQAAVVKLLWESWEQGTPDVSAEAILEAADSLGGRLRDLFARHPAWGNLVVSGKRRNTWRLGD